MPSQATAWHHVTGHWAHTRVFTSSIEILKGTKRLRPQITNFTVDPRIKLIVSFYAVAQRTVSMCCCDNRLAVFGCFINILYIGIYDFSLYQIVDCMGVFGLIGSLPLLMLFLVLSSLGGGLVGSRVCFDMESDTWDLLSSLC